MPLSKSRFLLLLLLAQTQIAFAAERISNSVVKTSTTSNLQDVQSASTNLTKDKSKALALAKQVVDANGGLANLKKFDHDGYRVSGLIRHFSSMSGSENSFDFTSDVMGNKQKITMDFMGQELVTGFDGKTCWSKQDNNVLPADPLASLRIKEEIDHSLLILEQLLEPDRKLGLLESVDFKGKKCDVLVAKADDGKDTRLFIDPKTHLVLRSEFDGNDQEQGTPCLKGYEYFNYKTVSGTKQPGRVVEYSDQKKVSDVTVKKFDTSVKLTEEVFQMPVGSRIARLDKGPVEVPFIYSNNQVLVKAKVNGVKDLLFLLDTGATQTILDSQRARELALVNPNASKNISITTGSGFIKMHSVQLESLQLGEIKLEQVAIATAKLQSLSAISDMEPAGLLGANILKRFFVTIDYDRQVVRFSDPDNVSIPEHAIVLETKPSLGMGGLAVEGTIDGGSKLTFLIDTGAAFNHVSRPLIADVLKDKKKADILPIGVIKGLDGTPVSTGAIIFDTLNIGSNQFPKTVFSISTAEAATNPGLISGGKIAILGNPFFSRYKLSIDYRNQRIFLERSPEKEIEDAYEEKIEDVMAAYRRSGGANSDLSLAKNTMQRIQTQARTEKHAGASALALAYEGLFLGYENNAETKSKSELNKGIKPEEMIPDKSISMFIQAYTQAIRTKSKKIAAQVLSVWAEHLLENYPPSYSVHASRLLSEAITLSPGTPEPVAVLGLFLLRQHQCGERSSKISLEKAVEVVNQALMLDPSNWIALKTKLEFARLKLDPCEPALIELQIKTYYPGVKNI